MADKTPKEVIEDYLAALRAGAQKPSEGAHRYLDLWHDDIEYTVPGLWPLGGVYESKADYIERAMPDYDPDYESDEPKEGLPDGGLYGYEMIAEGNIVCALARSRGRQANGMPYTNSFFLWFELDDDGKIIRYHDEADFSAGWQAYWGVHLE